MKLGFYKSKSGNDRVSISKGKQLFDETIMLRSPSERYSLACGSWYINDEASDDDGNEIENSETLFVFCGEEIAFSKKWTDCPIDEDSARLYDDGKLCVFDETEGNGTIYVFGIDGKRIAKRSIPVSYRSYEFEDDFVWFCGEDNNLNLKLWTFSFENMETWSKRLPNDVLDVTEVVKDETNGHILRVETYEDGEKVIRYDADGKFDKSYRPPVKFIFEEQETITTIVAEEQPQSTVSRDETTRTEHKNTFLHKVSCKIIEAIRGAIK